MVLTVGIDQIETIYGGGGGGGLENSIIDAKEML